MSRLLSAFTPRRSLLACGDHQLSLQQYHEVTCIRPRNTKTLSSAARQRSLFEELFPEESPSVQPNPVCSQIENDITPRLRLPEDGGVEESLKLDPSKQRPCTSSIIFSTFRSWDLAILVLSRVSNSLLDDDFRRVAPHGQHIDDWKGPGDILKGRCFPSEHVKLTENIISHSCPGPKHASTKRTVLRSFSQSGLRTSISKSDFAAQQTRTFPYANFS